MQAEQRIKGKQWRVWEWKKTSLWPGRQQVWIWGLWSCGLWCCVTKRGGSQHSESATSVWNFRNHLFHDIIKLQ